MCWSKNVSLGMGLLGLGFSIISSYYFHPYWTLSIFYFTLMQLIHYVGYTVINDCNNSTNRLMAYLNYIHVCFQPPIFLLGFYGLFSQYRILNKTELNVLMNFIIISIIVGFLLLIRIFSFKINKLNYELSKENCAWCGKTCSFKGKKHINFSLPLRNNPDYATPSIFCHALFMFLPLLLFNRLTRLISFIIFFTAFLPSFIFNLSPGETATIWCNISILQLIFSTYLIYNSKT